MGTHKLVVVELLDKGEVACCDEDVVACLDEGVVKLSNKNNKDDIYIFYSCTPLGKYS